MTLLTTSVRYLLLLLPALLVQAEEIQTSSDSSPADSNRIAREEEKFVLQALSKRITFECEDLSIDDALQEISQLIDCPIFVDSLKLGEEGISTEATVTLKIGEITAWQTLHFLLEPFHLTWVANDGVLEITTRTGAEEIFVTRVYDVHRLCQLLEPLTREVYFRQHRGKPQPGRAGGIGGGFFSIPVAGISNTLFSQFGGGAVQQPNVAVMVPKSVEAILASAIVQCTSLKWREREGDGGSIQLGQGCLIISQTYHGQFEIAGILQTLERLADGKVQGRSIAARRIGYPAEDDARIFAILSKPRTVEIEVGSLEQILRQIAQEADIRIWIDQFTLNEEGIAVDQSISPRRKMQKLPLSICLKKILEPFQLAVVVNEGVLVVTTQSRAAEMTTVRLYNIMGISRIANESPTAGVVSVLSRSTHGRWLEDDGEGGVAALISSKHLAVRQTQSLHAEIALLIDDLSKEELAVPIDPALELRVYTVTDVDTARDLERVLPQVLENRWSIRGSIRQAGTSLLINQPSTVHDRLDEIMEKLEQSYLRKNPSAKEPAESKGLDDPVQQKQ